MCSSANSLPPRTRSCLPCYIPWSFACEGWTLILNELMVPPPQSHPLPVQLALETLLLTGRGCARSGLGGGAVSLSCTLGASGGCDAGRGARAAGPPCREGTGSTEPSVFVQLEARSCNQDVQTRGTVCRRQRFNRTCLTPPPPGLFRGSSSPKTPQDKFTSVH